MNVAFQSDFNPLQVSSIIDCLRDETHWLVPYPVSPSEIWTTPTNQTTPNSDHTRTVGCEIPIKTS